LDSRWLAISFDAQHGQLPERLAGLPQCELHHIDFQVGCLSCNRCQTPPLPEKRRNWRRYIITPLLAEVRGFFFYVFDSLIHINIISKQPFNTFSAVASRTSKIGWKRKTNPMAQQTYVNILPIWYKLRARDLN